MTENTQKSIKKALCFEKTEKHLQLRLVLQMFLRSASEIP